MQEVEKGQLTYKKSLCGFHRDFFHVKFGVAKRIRTALSGVRGRRPNRIDDGDATALFVMPWACKVNPYFSWFILSFWLALAGALANIEYFLDLSGLPGRFFKKEMF